MNNNPQSPQLAIAINLFNLILTFFQGAVFSLFAIGIVGVIFTGLLGTSFEYLVVTLINLTPGLGSGDKTITTDNNSFFIFLGFWSLVWTILSELSKRFLKIKISISYSKALIVIFILHIAMLFSLSIKIGLSNSINLAIIFFIVNSITYSIYHLLQIFKKKLASYLLNKLGSITINFLCACSIIFL